MESATLNIRVMPRRMLNPREAATYCGLKVGKLEGCVAPIDMPGGIKLYDMRDLDDWIDRMKAGSADTDDDIIGKLG